MIKRITLIWLIILLSALACLVDAAPQHDPTADTLRIIRQIHIVGNRRTKPHIILRELTWRVGDTLKLTDTNQTFKANLNKVFNTSLFVTVGMSLHNVGAADSAVLPLADLIITVRERWYTFPSPIFELADRDFNDWWYNRNHDIRRVDYGLRHTQFNMRGRNEVLKLVLQAGFNKKYELFYTIPYFTKVLNEGIRLGVHYSTSKAIVYKSDHNRQVFYKDDEHNSRSRFYAVLGYTMRKGFYQTQSAELRFNYNTISDTVASLNPLYFLEGRQSQRYFEFTYSFVYDFRNIRAYPLKGYYMAIVANQQGLLPTDQVQITTLGLSFARYWDLTRGYYFASRFDLETSFPRRQPYYNMGALGFKNQIVRGYEKYVIEGTTPLSVKNALRKRIFSTVTELPYMPIQQFRTVPFTVYLKSHADFGYVANPLPIPGNERLTNTILAGTGLGLDFVTFYDLVLRLEYSVNRHLEKGLYFYLMADI